MDHNIIYYALKEDSSSPFLKILDSDLIMVSKVLECM